MSYGGNNGPYYYRDRGRTVGPFNLLQMRHKAKTAQIGPAAAVSRDGMEWRTLADFPELTVSDSPGPPQSAPEMVSEPAMTAVVEWYYSTDGTRSGPVSHGELVRLIDSGMLAGDHSVWRTGQADWTMVSETPELAHLARQTSATVSGPEMGTNLGFGGRGQSFCRGCGAFIHVQAVICPQCGVPTGIGDAHAGGAVVDRKDKTTAALLAFFLGYLGIHRFYLGDTGMGALFLLTCGVCGIGAFIDFLVLLLMNQSQFDLKYNRRVRR